MSKSVPTGEKMILLEVRGVPGLGIRGVPGLFTEKKRLE